jgi:hypothetical protein
MLVRTTTAPGCEPVASAHVGLGGLPRGRGDPMRETLPRLPSMVTLRPSRLRLRTPSRLQRPEGPPGPRSARAGHPTVLHLRRGVCFAESQNKRGSQTARMMPRGYYGALLSVSVVRREVHSLVGEVAVLGLRERARRAVRRPRGGRRGFDLPRSLNSARSRVAQRDLPGVVRVVRREPRIGVV